MAGNAKPFVLLPPPHLHDLYVRVRALEGGPAGWSAAAMAASVSHLKGGDLVVAGANDRSALAALCRLTGTEIAAAKPKRSTMDSAARLTAVFGMATAMKSAGRGGVVMYFAGCETDFFEAAPETCERSAEMRLPAFFVTQTPAGSSSRVEAKGSRPRLPRIAVDAHDAVAIYRVVQECLRHARTGGGPSWLDCQVLEGSRGHIASAVLTRWMEKRRILRESSVASAAARFAKPRSAAGLPAIFAL